MRAASLGATLLAAVVTAGACGSDRDATSGLDHAVPSPVTRSEAPAPTSPTADPTDPTADPTDPTPGTAEASSGAASTPAPFVPLDPPALGLVTVSEEVEAPMAIVVPERDSLWVADKGGEVVELDARSGERRSTLLDLRGEVSTGSEQGLLGMALAPDGDALYLNYTGTDGTSFVDEFPLVSGRPDATARRAVLRLDQPFGNHNGGHLTFGPDGYLYLGFGDGGSAGDPAGNAQNPGVLLGKILRIDPSGGEPYAIPADNPYAAAGGAAPEIWLLGVRNPWRFSFDRDTGDLWIGDVGQNEREEIDLLPRISGWGRGANLGWAAFEGTERFDRDTPEPAEHTPPVHEYLHPDGCSITGGFVYRGTALPALHGWYVYADYCQPELLGFGLGGDGSRRSEALGVEVPNGRIASFAEDLDGELFVLTIDQGRIYRLVEA
ncbi:MAG: PQQ-dependent sugar dehydrogenase [Acidimicrobiia bacterium]|nr:PQQ-dependent sugar dehydrogenase [Acidimicrobiia bacterium]